MENVNSAVKASPAFGISVFLILFFALGCFAQDIKEPNVAGAFYPADASELSETIDRFLNQANPEPIKAVIFALILPHAGYDFSGATAAFGYKLIKGKNYKTVIIIGPSHYYGLLGISVYPAGAFRTPLGEVAVDSEFAAKLIGASKEIRFIPQAFQKEHSIEVQIPFLEKTLSDFKIVPIVMGQVDFAACKSLADQLATLIAKRKDVLIVASTDMYHGYDYQEAEAIDRFSLSVLEEMDPEDLYNQINSGRVQFCGGNGVVVAMLTAKSLGHDKLKVLKYTNSAQVTGRKEKGVWTVGYTSCVIDQEGENTMLNTNQRKRLLEIARKSLETYLKSGKKLEINETDPSLLKKNGAFVTLREKGGLRGCIGNLVGSQPLYLTIRDMAVEAAVGDPRFPAVTAEELKEIEIEISVLSELKKIDDPLSIELGVHGVLVRRGFNSGVFLPQVATETGWSKEEFLSNLCSHKAGLAPDAWKDKSTAIYVFTAEVFSEKSH